ncbi:MAG: carbon-nitrogen hydrolase family protein [Deltaproteobacteria bacterium]|nr:carbon-nitrogen hydrolase family protein [Deltaproteobacteria bacterium]
MASGEPVRIPLLSYGQAALFGLGAAAAFHLAFTFPWAGFLIAVYVFCLFNLARAPSLRMAFYPGIGLGLLLFAPQLWFFWGLFGPFAFLLWTILALWIGGFLILARLCIGLCRRELAAALVPCLWTGLEYVKSELYYLKFSWLAPGYAFSHEPARVLMGLWGMYGVGFMLMLLSGALVLLPRRAAAVSGGLALALLGLLGNLPSGSPAAERGAPLIAGVQFEHPGESEVTELLDRALEAHPRADVLVLSEYTFHGPVPETVRRWCREHGRYLVLGAVDRPAEIAPEFRNTAFVIGPDGKEIFKQAKSVPIQFFADGLPAERQEVWDSPWGKIGICICYDLGYARVTDELIRKGARLLIVPTMDTARWGAHEHELHARVGPVRAAEYGVPIFRLASSGISQAIRSDGTVAVRGAYPGQGEIVACRLGLADETSLPADRYLAWPAVFIAAGCLLVLPWLRIRQRGRG